MAGSNIKSDDLILVSRGGVDYKAQVSDLPIPEVQDVDLSEYAKLDDDEQSITAKEFIGDGSKLTNVMPLDISTLPALN
jgi:hypothetical protein